MRGALALMVLVGALSACGGGGRSGWSDAECRREAANLADRADLMIRHYAGAVYPADVAYLLFRNGLSRYEAGRCDPGFVGDALERRLTPEQRRRFVELLPTAMARSVRVALQG
ncbi:MAG TPA: hypothetical protein VJT84_03935 [Gaiellaceae bacterium]|nr:hypothetical protein [Gaiellaceae bacterium]